MTSLKLTFACAATLLAVPVVAQQTMDQSKMDHSKMDHSKMDHSKMDHSKMGGMDHSKMMQNTAANPYAQSEMKMHQAMMNAMGANAAETWTRKMIEHHRGAIEMSRIGLTQAIDKSTRDMATKTMAMQDKEVAELQAWLKRNGKKPQ